MNSVLLHLLILWAVIAVVLGAIYGSRRGGVEFAGLKYAGIFGFVGAAFGVVIGMTTFFASQHYADVRQAAEHEATALGDVSALSGSFAPREGALLRQQLYCYATGSSITSGRERTPRGHNPSTNGRLPGTSSCCGSGASAVVAVLSGLDSPTQGPFGLKPTAMEAERALIVQDVDTGGQSPTAFCASLPLPQRTRTSLR